jgi:hypothetical protein
VDGPNVPECSVAFRLGRSQSFSSEESVHGVALRLSRLRRSSVELSDVGITTGVKLRGPEGAQRLRATSASTA